MTSCHFGGCELSSGKGINKISLVTAHLAEFRWILLLVHGFFLHFVLLCSSSWDHLSAAGRALRPWVRFGAMKLLNARLVLQFWIKSSTVWKAIPLQIRWKQLHTTSG